jgi:hypothetical protein
VGTLEQHQGDQGSSDRAAPTISAHGREPGCRAARWVPPGVLPRRPDVLGRGDQPRGPCAPGLRRCPPRGRQPVGGRDGGPRRHAGQRLRQGITFSLLRRGATPPARPDAPGARRRRVGRRRGGLRQRVKALEMFLADVYGAARSSEGMVPRRLVMTSKHFHRAALRRPSRCNGVRIHVAGDRPDPRRARAFRVLEDNLRSPSGVSYVLENRARCRTCSPRCSAATGAQRRRSTPPGCSARCAPPPRRTWTTPPSRCSPPACTTPRTSSTRSWPGAWAWSSSRAATCSAATGSCGCAPPAAASRCT